MNTIKEFVEQGLKFVRNDMDEIRHLEYREETKTASIVFPNGWDCDSILIMNPDIIKIV